MNAWILEDRYRMTFAIWSESVNSFYERVSRIGTFCAEKYDHAKKLAIDSVFTKLSITNDQVNTYIKSGSYQKIRGAKTELKNLQERIKLLAADCLRYLDKPNFVFDPIQPDLFSNYDSEVEASDSELEIEPDGDEIGFGDFPLIPAIHIAPDVPNLVPDITDAPPQQVHPPEVIIDIGHPHRRRPVRPPEPYEDDFAL